MSAIELRSLIIQKLNTIEDKSILEDVYNLVKLETDMTLLYKVSEAEEKAIEAGLRDIKDGKVFSSAQANTVIKEWLKK